MKKLLCFAILLSNLSFAAEKALMLDCMRVIGSGVTVDEINACKGIKNSFALKGVKLIGSDVTSNEIVTISKFIDSEDEYKCMESLGSSIDNSEIESCDNSYFYSLECVKVLGADANSNEMNACKKIKSENALGVISMIGSGATVSEIKSAAKINHKDELACTKIIGADISSNEIEACNFYEESPSTNPENSY